jgi:Mitochondrial carrier protein
MGYLNSDSLFHIGLSGMFAGVIVSIITNPILLLKTKQQTASRNGRSLGFREAMHETLADQRKRSAPLWNKNSMIQELYPI